MDSFIQSIHTLPHKQTGICLFHGQKNLYPMHIRPTDIHPGKGLACQVPLTRGTGWAARDSCARRAVDAAVAATPLSVCMRLPETGKRCQDYIYNPALKFP